MNYKIKYLVFISILFFIGCVAGQRAAQTLPSQTVTIEEGSFIFHNLTISRNFSGYTLFGNMTNNTDKSWNDLKFDIIAEDLTGRDISDNLFTRNDLSFWKVDKRGNESIRSGYGESIYIKKGHELAKVSFKFTGGTYPTKYIAKMIQPVESNLLLFENDKFLIQFKISNMQIGFEMKNKTNSPIKIDWNQAAYVDVLEKSHRVIHSGVKLVNRNEAQPPTIVPPLSRIDDIVYPSDYIEYESGRYGGWTEKQMFPEGPQSKNYEGLNFSVYLPLEINGVIENLMFVFKIEKIES